MADVTSSTVGLPVTTIWDGTGSVPGSVVDSLVTSAEANMEVKYVPTPGAADDE